MVLGSSPKEDDKKDQFKANKDQTKASPQQEAADLSVDRVISRNKAIIEGAEKVDDSGSPGKAENAQRDADAAHVTAEEEFYNLEEFECPDKNALGFNNFISSPNLGKSLFACPYCWYSTDLRDYFHVHLREVFNSPISQFLFQCCNLPQLTQENVPFHLNWHITILNFDLLKMSHDIPPHLRLLSPYLH